MRHVLSLLMFLFTGILLLGCDSSSRGTSPTEVLGPPSVDTPLVESKMTCIEASQGLLPAGSWASFKGSKSKMPLDSNGCFKVPSANRIAARSMKTDSILIYNDSALFTVTLPFKEGGQHISVVPTIINLRNVPNPRIDSAFVVVFDRENPTIQRQVKLKRTNYGTYSDYSRTLWSSDDGGTFQVHFNLQEPNRPIKNAPVITSEPGGVITVEFDMIKEQLMPRINIADTLIFNSTPDSFVTRLDMYSFLLDSALFNTSTAKVNPVSIYGIASITIDGIAMDSINEPEFEFVRIKGDTVTTVTVFDSTLNVDTLSKYDTSWTFDSTLMDSVMDIQETLQLDSSYSIDTLEHTMPKVPYQEAHTVVITDSAMNVITFNTVARKAPLLQINIVPKYQYYQVEATNRSTVGVYRY